MKKFLPFLPYLIIFIAALYRPYDADLGWHLKYGEYFFNTNQILRENIFSTSMPHYNWVNHSWGSDLITFAIFNTFGFIGLSVLGAFIVAFTFYFFSKAAKLTIWDQVFLFPLVLWYLVPVIQVSFRSQIMSLLFLGILFFILSRYTYKNWKILLILFPLFLLWVNVHGQFILGVSVFILWAALEIVKKIIFQESRDILLVKKEGVVFLGILGLIIIATFLNPFGLGVYKEAINHFGNPSQKYILEWLPFAQTSELWWKHIILGILIFFSVFFSLFSGDYKKKFSFVVLIVFFLGLSFWMKRYAWPTYLISLLALSPIAAFFKPNGENTTIRAAFIILIFFLLGALYTKLPLNQFSTMSWEIYCQEYNHCSSRAVQYLSDKKLTSNVLTFYNWGGWLIWNYPKIKPSIDGRMPFWKDEKGQSAFVEYYKYEQNQKDIDKWKYDIVFMSPEKPMYTRLVELMDEKKWNLMYEDDFAGIFVRNKSKTTVSNVLK